MDQHMGVSSSTTIRSKLTGGLAATPVIPTLVWQRLALGAILLLTTFLNLFHLTHEGYSNLYYAATVRTML